MTGNGHDNINPKTRALINELFSDPIAISRGESGELRLRIAELEAEVERLKAEHATRENELLKELFVWADNWLPDEAKDQGARAVLQKVRAALAGQTGEP